MDRRDFLRVTGAAGLATMWGSSLACAGSSAAATGAPRNAGAFSLSNVGLQLYTVRDAMGKDPDATLAAIAAAEDPAQARLEPHMAARPVAPVTRRKLRLSIRCSSA